MKTEKLKTPTDNISPSSPDVWSMNDFAPKTSIRRTTCDCSIHESDTLINKSYNTNNNLKRFSQKKTGRNF